MVNFLIEKISFEQISHSHLEYKTLFYRIKDFNLISHISLFLFWHVGPFVCQINKFCIIYKIFPFLSFPFSILYFLLVTFVGRWSLINFFWSKFPERICMVFAFNASFVNCNLQGVPKKSGSANTAVFALLRSWCWI